MTKAELRNICRARLRALSPEYRQSAGARITSKVLARDAFRNAETVFCYVSVPPEPDTRRLIAEALKAGKTVCVPRCRGAGEMDAVPIRSLSELKEGRYGIPVPEDAAEPCDRTRIDLCVVPCLSAGTDGTRLGHGGGYYDRFLAETKTEKLCLCYREMLTEGIPTEETDIRADAVVTD